MRWFADIGSKAEGASLRERERRWRGEEQECEREIEIEIKGGSVMVSLLVGRVRTAYKYRGGSGGGAESGIAAERESGGGTKWGDRDNDNVRSALAGGLLRLMDALIISKQELQCFA